MDQSSEPVSVLAVDDDPALLDLIGTFLEQESSRINTTTKTTAESALTYLEENPVDCVISDYDMPGRNGIEFLEEVREDDPDLPFLLYTGKGSEEIASEAISLDVTDYVQKQTGTGQYSFLARRIEQAVDQYRMETEINRIYWAVESAQEGISLLDEDGRFTYLNEAYADKYGYAVGDLIGEHWETVYQAEDAETIRTNILPVVEEHGGWHGETTGKRKDGSTFPEDHVITKATDGGLVCAVRDITEQKARQQRLERERAFLKSSLDALDDMFYVIDENGNPIRWNARAREVTGYTDDEIASMDAADFVVPDDRKAVRESLATVLETAESQTVQVHLLTKSGDELPYEITGSPLHDEAGKTVGICGIARRLSDLD